jgi:hypothetical protein
LESGPQCPRYLGRDSTLQTYAYPVLGGLPVHAIDTALVMKVIEPIWSAKPETAGRLRGRIESILDWVSVRGYRRGENPARWRGHLQKLLPARSKVRKIAHHPALPYASLPAFMAIRPLMPTVKLQFPVQDYALSA